MGVGLHFAPDRRKLRVVRQRLTKRAVACGPSAPVGGGIGVAASNQQAQNVDLVCRSGGVEGIGLAGACAVLAEDGWQPQDAVPLG
jgi:predicted acylesterase/phospholipase RssA